MLKTAVTAVFSLFLLISCTDKRDTTNDCSCGLLKQDDSEDYGFGPGFGFTYGNIIQPTMPAIGGNRTFKTKADAFKAGLLMMYKHGLTQYDLVFLQFL